MSSRVVCLSFSVLSPALLLLPLSPHIKMWASECVRVLCTFRHWFGAKNQFIRIRVEGGGGTRDILVFFFWWAKDKVVRCCVCAANLIIYPFNVRIVSECFGDLLLFHLALVCVPRHISKICFVSYILIWHNRNKFRFIRGTVIAYTHQSAHTHTWQSRTGTSQSASQHIRRAVCWSAPANGTNECVWFSAKCSTTT